MRGRATTTAWDAASCRAAEAQAGEEEGRQEGGPEDEPEEEVSGSGPMNYREAQEQSVSGVAVFGNPAMQDIIWPKHSPHPFAWVGKGYMPVDPARFCDRDGWSPLHVRCPDEQN